MSVFHYVTLPCPWLLNCAVFYIWCSKILQNKYWCGLVKCELWAIEINNNCKIFWLQEVFWLRTQAFVPAFSLWIGLFFPASMCYTLNLQLSLIADPWLMQQHWPRWSCAETLQWAENMNSVVNCTISFHLRQVIQSVFSKKNKWWNSLLK